MFDRFAVPSTSPSRPRTALLGASIGLHAAAALTLALASTWPIERLDLPERPIVLAIQPSLPDPPAEPPPASPPRAEPPRNAGAPARSMRRVHRRQPEPSAPDVASAVQVVFPGPGGTAEPGPGDVTSGGSGIGMGGTGSASLMPTLTPPPPPAAPAPREVAARLLEGRRTAGNAHIPPPATVQASMLRTGQQGLRAHVRLCLASTGRVASVEVIRSSGYEDYDDALLREMRGWRYQPYRAGGNPVAVCTTVTFVYRLQ